MAAPLLFVPHGTDPLAFWPAGCPEERREITSGPEGLSGLLVALADDRTDHAYRPERQRAIERKLRGRHWWIWARDAPPTPGDLQRERLYPSVSVTLADGHAWQVPVATRLPHHHSLDDEGRIVRQVSSEYGRYYDSALQWYDRFTAWSAEPDTPQTIDLQEVFEHLASGLALNYYLTPELVGLLRLVSDTCWPAAVAASFEYATSARVKKKGGVYVLATASSA